MNHEQDAAEPFEHRNPHLPYSQQLQVHHVVLAGLAAKYTADGRVLDIGCGLGHMLAELARLKPGLGLYGADIDQECLDQTSSRVPEAQLIPMRPDRFDTERLGTGYSTLTMSHVLEHLPHPLETIRRLLDLVRPGGHLILGVPNPMTPTNIVATLLRQQRVNPGHLQTWDRAHWTTFLEGHVRANVVEYAGDEVRVFPGSLKRLRLFRQSQVALAKLLPWWTFTMFAVIRVDESDG